MSEQELVPANGAEMSDEQIVAFTQGKRRELVDDMTKGGIPTDKGDRLVLLTALGDMDRTAVAKMKIGSKERQGAQDREVALITAKLISQFGNKSPFERAPDDQTVRRLPAPELDDTDGAPLIVLEGETEVGLANIDYHEFMDRMDAEAKAR